MSLHEIRNRYARGALLELLRDGTKASDATLTMALQNMKALQVTRDQVKAALDWLERQGYVSIERVESFRVARIRQAGLDFLAGHTADDGIQRDLE